MSGGELGSTTNHRVRNPNDRELFTNRGVGTIYDGLAGGLLNYLGRRGQPAKGT
jgi:hypothetical protein